MSRPILRLWLLAVVPLLVLPTVFIAGVVLPSTFLASHALFHIVYIPVIVLAIRTLLAYAKEAPTGLLRNLARTAAVFQAVGLFGHVGELTTVFLNGGFNAPESLFEDSWHTFFASFAPTGLLASALTVIVLSIVVAVRRARNRTRETTAA